MFVIRSRDGAARRATVSAVGILLAGGLLAGPSLAQQSPNPGVDAAIGLLRNGDAAGAKAALQDLTAAEPENYRAWTVLGFTLRQLGENREAIVALERALMSPDDQPQALYTLAMLYAGEGRSDEAFGLLERARRTGRVDLTQMDLDPASEPLRADPRYAALLPRADEFDDPFLEPTEIIHEWRGEGPGESFGWIARNIGDVDGDGIDDVVTSAPFRAVDGQAGAGRIYAYSGGSGRLLWTVDGNGGDQLGLGVDSAGDVNGDGTPDVAAGGPGGERALILSGRDGAILLEAAARDSGETFGRDLQDVGDIDGDGHDDLIIGAPGNSEGRGRAYVVSGRDGSTMYELSGERAGDGFGSAVAGSLLDDGTMVLVVGAPNAGPAGGGRTYVWVTDSPNGEPTFVIEGDETSSQLGGMFVSVVGDIDADGHPDVYASDWSNNANGSATGRVYVHSGASGAPLHVLTGEAAGDGFGIGPADAGDVDGDGHDDLVIGAWQEASAAAAGGKVYVFSGKDGSILRAYTGKVMGEAFGFDATGIGDVNGDGAIDYLVTSASSALKGPRTGRVYILAGP